MGVRAGGKDSADGVAVIEFRRGVCMMDEHADVVATINLLAEKRGNSQCIIDGPHMDGPST
jgi:hypothetical protein